MGWSKFSCFLLVLFLISFIGCVKYSFKGALPSYLKTISIPVFEDRTSWPGLREELTNKVVDAFIQDNTLRVIDDEKSADLLLKGTISSLQEKYAAITEREEVEQTELWVSVRIECLNQHTNKPLWKGVVSDFGIISGAGTLDEKNAAISQALDKIVNDILNNVIAAW